MMNFVFSLVAWLTNESSERQTPCICSCGGSCSQSVRLQAAIASFRNTCLSRAMELFLLKRLIREILSLLSMIFLITVCL